MQNKLRQWPKDKYCISPFIQVCEVVRFMGSENRKMASGAGKGRESVFKGRVSVGEDERVSQ